MLAENFATTNHFLFAGDSGVKIGNRWKFSNQTTGYLLNPTNWYMSEKLDGVRAFWDSKRGLVSRNGNKFAQPEWFLADLNSDFILDGELYIENETASTVSGIVHRKSNQDGWKRIIYHVFDIVIYDKTFAERTHMLSTMLFPREIRVVPQIKVKSMDHAYQFYKSVLMRNGEGIVLRDPDSLYENKRSNKFLKWKPVQTMEAKVVDFHADKHNQLGSFQVQLLDSDVQFRLAGKMSHVFVSQYVFKHGHLVEMLSDEVPRIGDIVTFEYMSLSKHGVPRQAVFLAKRLD